MAEIGAIEETRERIGVEQGFPFAEDLGLRLVLRGGVNDPYRRQQDRRQRQRQAGDDEAQSPAFLVAQRRYALDAGIAGFLEIDEGQRLVDDPREFGLLAIDAEIDEGILRGVATLD